MTTDIFMMFFFTPGVVMALAATWWVTLSYNDYCERPDEERDRIV